MLSSTNKTSLFLHEKEIVNKTSYIQPIHVVQHQKNGDLLLFLKYKGSPILSLSLSVFMGTPRLRPLPVPDSSTENITSY